jgi:hypothetical protein
MVGFNHIVVNIRTVGPWWVASFSIPPTKASGSRLSDSRAVQPTGAVRNLSRPVHIRSRNPLPLQIDVSRSPSGSKARTPNSCSHIFFTLAEQRVADKEELSITSTFLPSWERTNTSIDHTGSRFDHPQLQPTYLLYITLSRPFLLPPPPPPHLSSPTTTTTASTTLHHYHAFLAQNFLPPISPFFPLWPNTTLSTPLPPPSFIWSGHLSSSRFG